MKIIKESLEISQNINEIKKIQKEFNTFFLMLFIKAKNFDERDVDRWCGFVKSQLGG